LFSKDENYFQEPLSHRASMHGSLLIEISPVLAFRGMLDDSNCFVKIRHKIIDVPSLPTAVTTSLMMTSFFMPHYR